MGRWSESRIRRTAIYFLPTYFLDVRRRARISSAVDFCAGRVHRFDSDPGGDVRLCVGAAFIPATWRFGVRGLLRRESLRATHRVHAQRFRGATQTLAGMCAFALGRRLFPQRGALVCAVCYAANPYALLIVYMRSDFAEQLALAFFPILFLAAAEVADLLASSAPSLRRSIVFLAITFAAVWLTNAPAAVVASYSLAMLFAWTALTQKSWRALLHGGAALALGFGAASFYLVPAAYEQSWVNISLALASGLQPSQNVLYTVIADPEHNAFNRIASNAAVLMMALTAVFAALSFPRG